ncbi:MAG: hypothetical protein ACTTJS_04970 [Wolinella sp.]
MKKFSALIFAMLFLLGCGEMDTTAGKLHLDRDVCERCKMIISEKNHALEVINKSERKRYYFDDIGCLALWVRDNKISWIPEAIIYVGEFNTGEWIDAKSALWVEGHTTPMAFGYAAYAQQKRESIASTGKKIYSFEQVMEKIAQEKGY